MVNSDDLFMGNTRASYDLFVEMKCTLVASDKLPFKMDPFNLDEDKIRCHILDCLVALRRVQREKMIKEFRYLKKQASLKGKKIMQINHQLESTKSRIFASVVSIIIDDKGPIENSHIVKSLLQSFHDREKMTDGRSWLPLHIAAAFENKVEDFKILYSDDPLAMRKYHLTNTDSYIGYTPGHLLCMQKHPNISLIGYLSMRDITAFTMITSPMYDVRTLPIHSSQVGRNVLQLASKYSENFELLKILLQIDPSMTSATVDLDRSVIHGVSPYIICIIIVVKLFINIFIYILPVSIIGIYLITIEPSSLPSGSFVKDLDLYFPHLIKC